MTVARAFPRSDLAKPTPLLAVAGVALTLALGAVALACFLAVDVGIGPSDTASRAVVSAALLATPGLIGLAGIVRSRPTLLVAAGVLLLIQAVGGASVLALGFAFPAVLLLRAAWPPTSARPRRPAGWSILLAIAAVPIALLVALLFGLLGVFVLVLLGGIHGLVFRPARKHPTPAGAFSSAIGIAVVVLMIAAWAALVGVTETRCWVARQAGDDLVYEDLPPTFASLERIEGEYVASGCESGVPATRGVPAAAVLATAALGAAWLPTRRREGRGGPA